MDQSHTPAAGAVFAADAAAQTGQQGGAYPSLYPGLNARQFQALRDHENAHVAAVTALIQSLGGTPRPKPNFRGLAQPDLTTFINVTQNLENTGVGAYLGAAPAIFSRKVVGAAGSIALIEARHAGYLNALVNDQITTNLLGEVQTIERPLTIQQVVDAASPFILNLNNGPPLTFSTTPSRGNDVAILNFALALEFLEAEFYNVNVPRFYPAR